MLERATAALAVITLVGAILRFAFLSQSIWYDEAITVTDISRGWHHLLSMVTNVEVSPPMSFALLWLWHGVTGTHAATLRLLPALAGTLTIPAAYAAAREIVGRRTALATAALIATNPMLIYYSGELRPYALEVLVCTIGFAAFLRVIKAPNRGFFLVWVVSSILAVAMHYFAVLAVAPQAAWLLRANWRTLHRLRIAVGVLVVGGASAAWLPLAAHQFSHTTRFDRQQLSSPFAPLMTSGQEKLTITSGLGRTVKQVLVGPAGPLKTITIPFVFLAFLLALTVIWRQRRNGERRAILLVLSLVAFGLLTESILLLSHFTFYPRYALPLVIPGLLAAAFGLMQLRGRRLGAFVVATLCAVWVSVSVAVATVPEYSARDDLRGVSHALGRATADRLVAIYGAFPDLLPLKLYRPDAVVPSQRFASVKELDVIALPQRSVGLDNVAARPPVPQLRTLPSALRLVDTFIGPNYVIERYVASRPVNIALDPTSGLFDLRWRFLLESRGARGSGL